MVRKQSRSEVMIYPLGKDEDNVCRPVCHAPAKILFVLLLYWTEFFFSSDSFRTGISQTWDSINPVLQRKKITVLILSETHYISEDMWNQALFFPVQKSRFEYGMKDIDLFFYTLCQDSPSSLYCYSCTKFNNLIWIPYMWSCYCTRSFWTF